MTEHLKPYQFKKGQSGNPGGAPKMPEDLKKAASLTKVEFLQKLVDFLQKPVSEIEAMQADKSLKAIDLWVSRVCLLGIKHGDTKRLDFMMDRLIGKVSEPPKQVDINLHQMPIHDVIEIGEKAIKYLKESEE